MKTIGTLLIVLAALCPRMDVSAQEHEHGYHGVGHEKWHGEFYSKLMQPGSKQPCCNLADCRPTSIRTVDDHYEIQKDGRWIPVDPSKIVKTTAPDGGAHICAPTAMDPRYGPDMVFCIIMPMET